MRANRRVLLTVSGSIPDGLDEDVAAGRRPRADYRVMAQAFDSDVVDVDSALSATGRTGRALNRIGGAGAVLGWFCFRHRRDYDVIVTDGEQVGLPFALLSRVFGRGRARHMTIVHILSTRSKSQLIRFSRIAPLIDRYVVYSSWQGDFIHHELGVPRERIVLSTFMVDTEFFNGSTVEATPRRMICSAGLERRDYPTLMDAVRGLDVDVVIAASSPWSKRSDSTADAELPPNVTVRRLSLFELRSLYAECQFVVMPLDAVEFQAGITTILEAMSMGRPVICTRTPGQTDTIIADETGTYVPPGDAGALRAAIVEYLDNSDLVAQRGDQARQWVVDHADVERYAGRLADEVRQLQRF